MVICENNQEQFHPYLFQIGSRVVIAGGIVVIKGVVSVGMSSRKFNSAVIPSIGLSSCGIALILSCWACGRSVGSCCNPPPGLWDRRLQLS